MFEKNINETIHILIIKNERLSFKNSEDVIIDYITKRLQYFGIKYFNFIEKNSIDSFIINNNPSEKYFAIIDILNPLIDFELLQEMFFNLKNSKTQYAIQQGAIPGTQIDYLLAPNSILSTLDEKHTLVRWNTQAKYNNQFNLYKYKRLKIFLLLLKEINNLHELDIPSFNSILEQEEIFNKIVAFGEEVKLLTHKKCPHCKSELKSLEMSMSQSFCGYIPKSKPLYYECANCSLIVLSPYIEAKSTYKIYDDFDTQDFSVSENNPYIKSSPRCNFDSFIKNLPKKVKSLDIGGGMGEFSKYLKQTYPKWKVTHSDFEIKQNIELEKFGIKTKTINFTKEKLKKESYNLITAWEVLEHIPFENLEYSIQNIYSALKKGGYFLFSTPDFESALCKSNDFFAIAPPFHYLVFNKSWLNNYFQKKPQWKIHSTSTCSDFLDDSQMWFDYTKKTAPSFQLQATAEILQLLLSKKENIQLLLDKGIGTEVIFVLQKQ